MANIWPSTWPPMSGMTALRAFRLPARLLSNPQGFKRALIRGFSLNSRRPSLSTQDREASRYESESFWESLQPVPHPNSRQIRRVQGKLDRVQKDIAANDARIAAKGKGECGENDSCRNK